MKRARVPKPGAKAAAAGPAVTDEKEVSALKKLTPVICHFLMKLSNDGKRRRIVCEMIETERNYVNSLCICEEVYYRPLDRSITSKTPLIDTATLGKLFGNIDQIRDVHQNVILKAMDEALAQIKKPFPPHEAYTKIANTFVECSPRLQQLYTSYLSSNENYEEILKKLKKNRKFANFLNEALFNPRSKCQEVEDLLILPTQRIAGYKLLFERIMKYFPVETHKEENNKFNTAYKALLNVGKEMDSEKNQDSRSQDQLLTVAENITKQPPFLCIMKPGRRSLGTFRCREIDAKGKKGANYIIFVLSDILLITIKPEKSIFSSNKLIYVDAVPFTQVHFSPFTLDKEMDRAFVLKTDTIEYNFWVKNSSERDDFIMGIKKQKKIINYRVKNMSEIGAEYMQNVLSQLRNLYSKPPPALTREEALASLQ
ncbi:RhoGEF domain containing protein [Tritrichomonas foetus]|uniref:RhoGEF domain containing protein n=1 Tax=Tritrichomonas foetus TaxID=1144522 RepID=A0A1J4JHI2_9EUKA|nr:RhoGEF domain containing protein [Tritrichomonas foetus]|eukprot:OHS98608.1 RhoGEF domain containing protein [Tritrichomonas foetus]